MNLQNDLQNLPLLKPAIPFILGIALAAMFDPGGGILSYGMSNLQGGVLWGLLILLLLLLLIFFGMILKSGSVRPQRERQLASRWWVTMQAPLLVTVCLLSGYAHFRISTPYTKCNAECSEVWFSGVICRPATERNQWVRFMVDVEYIECEGIVRGLSERILLYVPASELNLIPAQGDRVTGTGDLSPIQNMPESDFDYAAYMARQGCFFSCFSRKVTLTCSGGSGTIRASFNNLRNRLLATWSAAGMDYAVIAALTLGTKDYLDGELRDQFAKAGAMHLLAVSGLHVGLIWWVLEKLLQLIRWPLFRRWIKPLIVTLLLWGFAGLSGFSDSVTRAVTMFTIATLARMSGRNISVFQSVLLSGVILLLQKPDRLLEPGFQLSYSAVIGIIAMHPLWSQIIRVRSRALRWVMDLVFVSLSAQIATLPLVLFYFHQFPTWFLFTNLISMPLVTVVLVVFVVSFPWMLLLPSWDIPLQLMSALTDLLKGAVGTISALPGAVIQVSGFSPMLLLPAYLALISTILFSYYRRIRYLNAALLFSSILLLVFDFAGF